jgi:hypothetical protein
MAIQMLPILKALAPIITTAGGVFNDWQRSRDAHRYAEELSAGQLKEVGEQMAAVERNAAQNAHLIAQLGEQLQAVAEQLEAHAERAERQARAGRRLALAAAGLAMAALAVAVVT